MRKFLTAGYLKEYGWNNIDVNKGHVISYCNSCRSQSIYHCTGKKDDNGCIIFRLECEACEAKLNGKVAYDNGTNYK